MLHDAALQNGIAADQTACRNPECGAAKLKENAAAAFPSRQRKQDCGIGNQYAAADFRLPRSILSCRDSKIFCGKKIQFAAKLIFMPRCF